MHWGRPGTGLGPIQTSIPHFLGQFQEIYKRVEEAGEQVNEGHRCYMIPKSLGHDYDYLVKDFENRDDTKFTFEKLKEEILKDYNCRIIRDKDKQECNTIDNQTPICKNCSIKEIWRSRNITPQSSAAFFTEYISESYHNNSFPTTQEWTLDSASTSHVRQRIFR